MEDSWLPAGLLGWGCACVYPRAAGRWSPPPAFLHPGRAQGPVLPPTCVYGGQEKPGSAPVLSPILWEAQPARPPARGLRPPSPSALQPCLPLSLAAKRRKARALLGSSLFLMVLCVPSTVSHVPAVLNVYVCKRDGNDRRCNSGESSGELAYWGDSVSDESPEWAGDPEGQPGGPPEKDLAGAGGEGGWSAVLPCGCGQRGRGPGQVPSRLALEPDRPGLEFQPQDWGAVPSPLGAIVCSCVDRQLWFQDASSVGPGTHGVYPGDVVKVAGFLPRVVQPACEALPGAERGAVGTSCRGAQWRSGARAEARAATIRAELEE